MSQRREFYDLHEDQQRAIREYELRQIVAYLVKDNNLDRKTANEFVIRALNKYNIDQTRLAWIDELTHQMNKLTTKDQHLAYLYLKGIGINKIREILKIGQPTIEEFIARPKFDMFPSPHSGVWILTKDIEKAQEDLVRRSIIIKPNICGGF